MHDAMTIVCTNSHYLRVGVGRVPDHEGWSVVLGLWRANPNPNPNPNPNLHPNPNPNPNPNHNPNPNLAPTH